jgi:hypothetical protein
MAGNSKKVFMIHFWRIQQCQTIISVLFWSATLAGVFFPFLSPWFVRFGLIEQHQVGLGLTYIFLMVLGIISLFGYIYDVFLKMWVEMNIVSIERDIYARTKQYAKEIVQWQIYFIPILRKVGRNHEADFFEKWNERCMEEDPRLRRDVMAIVKWVTGYKLRSKDERWLKDLQKEFWANIDDKEFKKFEKEVGSS